MTVVAACLSVPLLHSAQGVADKTQNVSWAVYDCNTFEPILFTGTQHVVSTQSNSAGGRHTVIVYTMSNVRGIDGNGQKYTGQNSSITTELYSPGVFELTYQSSMRVIAMGSGVASTMDMFTKFTQTPSGDIAAQIINTGFSCAPPK